MASAPLLFVHAIRVLRSLMLDPASNRRGAVRSLPDSKSISTLLPAPGSGTTRSITRPNSNPAVFALGVPGCPFERFVATGVLEKSRGRSSGPR